MPDFERRLISKAAYVTDYEAVINSGVTEDMFFSPEHRKVFVYAVEFVRTHQRSPTPRVFGVEFPKYKLLDRVDEPLVWLIDRVRKDYLQQAWSATGDRMADALEAGDPTRAAAAAAETIKLTMSATPTGKTVDVGQMMHDYRSLWQSRKKMKGHLIGISSGVDSVDEATLGFQPSQLVTIVGLAGAGKSTLAMRMARAAQQQQKRSYFMSFEMTEEEQIARYMSMAINVTYNKIVSWEMAEEEEAAFDKAMVEAAEASVFTLCTDIARSSTVSGLEAELRRHNLPEVAFIDGVYMMRDEQTKMSGADWQAMTNITRDLKQLAQRLEIPIVITTQALPSKVASKKDGHRRLDMYSPGYSSSFAQDSDVMFALEKDERRPGERILRIVKARHCAAHSVKVNWVWGSKFFGAPIPGTAEYEQIDPEDYEVDDEDDGDGA